MINLNNFNMKHIFNNKNKNFLFESTSLGQLQTSVIIWDETDEIVYLSPLAKEIFQRETKEEVNEKCSWTNLFPAEIVYKVNEHFNKTTEQLHLQDVTVHTDGKHKFKYDLTIDNILIHKKDHYICLLQDLSYIKDLEHLLQDMERLMLTSQLSSGLVHEIRNPLTSLKGFLQLVQAGVKQKEQYYRVILSEIEKLEIITAELLQLGKPLKRTKRKENIARLIRDVIFLFQVQADFREIDFELDMEEDVFFTCNALQIKQILMNIVKNGAEAMQNRGTISITLQQNETSIEIHIADEGKGIAPNDVQQLHEPFFSTKDDGTGLGLLVTNHLVEIHDGKLTVQSKENIGTTFSIILPRENKNEE